MSLPSIPNITPLISLDHCDTINLLLSSIALEEIGLSHILNAEGEKLQHFLKTNPCYLDDFLAMNNSINKTLRTIVKSQMMLVLKLEDVAELAEQAQCSKNSSSDENNPNQCCKYCGKPCKGTCKNPCCKNCGKPCGGKCKEQHCKYCGKPCGDKCHTHCCHYCGKPCEGIHLKPCCKECLCFSDHDYDASKENCFFLLKECETPPKHQSD